MTNDNANFKWPAPIKPVSLAKLLNTKLIGDKSIRHDISQFKEKYGDKLEKTWYVVDVHSSDDDQSCQLGVSPCITRARGGAGGHYVPRLGRCFTLKEIGLLQGLPRKIVANMVSQGGVSKRQVGLAIGDAMSVNVLMRLMPRALYSAGLLPAKVPDLWQAAGDNPRGGRNFVAQKAFDAFLRRDSSRA